MPLRSVATFEKPARGTLTLSLHPETPPWLWQPLSPRHWRAWKARPSRLHILIKFVSSHACVCMPSVENPVALGLTSGSHRHRASFDFYLLLTLIYCHPGAQITFFKFFLTWGGVGWGGVALMLAWALDCGADQISISNLGGGLWVTTPSHLNVSLRHSLLCACYISASNSLAPPPKNLSSCKSFSSALKHSLKRDL